MWKRAGNWPNCAELCVVVGALLVAAGCSRESRVRVGDEIHMGAYTLRITSAEGYSREHQGVPYEVAIRVECKGGNRFERADFAEGLSRAARIHFATAQKWRERAWLLRRGGDADEFLIQVNPPPNSTGMTLEFRNPWPRGGEPDRIVVDLGI